MGFYDDMQAVATDVLTEFAQGAVTLTRVTPGEVDPEEPWVVPEPETTSYALKAAVRGVSQELVDGSEVVASDLMVTAAVPEIVPAMTDLLEIDGRAMTLVRIDAIPAAGTVVAYRLIVRA
ncbi:MAG: hypothetical protein LOX97_08205 [Sphingomonas sp.]|nr:hypothetical protein [Sphingomonas sp.]